MSSYSEIINDVKISVSDFVCTIGGEIKNSESVVSSVKNVGDSGIDALKVLISSSITGVELTINKLFVSDNTEEEEKEKEDTAEEKKEEIDTDLQ
jgi:hypothetical protein